MNIIAIEGLDHSGKAVQSHLLFKHLVSLGYKVVSMDFPQYGTQTGKIIKQYLYNHLDVDRYTFELLQTADKQAQMKNFEQWEKKGTDFLICDRYTTSQMIYAEANEIDVEWTIVLQKYMRKPNLEIYIDITPEESMKRKGKHGENDRYESDLEMLTSVRNLYNLYVTLFDTIYRVDGMQGVSDVHSDIIRIVNHIFGLEAK